MQDNIEKRYFIVPLKLSKQPLDPRHVKEHGQRTVLSYHIDRKLLAKTERLHNEGYKNCQSNVIEWLRGKGLLATHDLSAQQALLEKWMLVKEDKPNSCYHHDMFL